MNRIAPRQLAMCLALVVGALLAAWYPVPATAQGAPGTTAFVAVPTDAAAQTGHLGDPAAVAEALAHHGGRVLPSLPLERRGPSWHRRAGVRSTRTGSSQALPGSETGSIPAALTLYSERLEWHELPLPAVHGAGGLAAPPRAPPR